MKTLGNTKTNNVLIKMYHNGKLSLSLIGVLLFCSISFVIIRILSFAHLKEISILAIKNSTQAIELGTLPKLLVIQMVLIVIALVSILVYFIVWKLDLRKIQLNTILVYSLILLVIVLFVFFFKTMHLYKPVTYFNSCFLGSCDTSYLTQTEATETLGIPNYFTFQLTFILSILLGFLNCFLLLPDLGKKWITFSLKEAKHED